MQYHRILALCLAATITAGATGAALAQARSPETALAKAPGAFRALAQPGTLEKGAFLPSFGNWFDLANPGWGLDIQRVGNLLFVVWFIYRADGTPIWYVAVGELDGMSWTGNIDVFSWNAGTRTATPTSVGTMTINWSDETTATVSWTLNGQSGGADIAFAVFATGPTLANMTGHYFPFFTPGWGFTLLTQGDVTVMTMYFYRNGQPIWLQGVVGTPGFNPAMVLNYFFAPDLCPECLARKGTKSTPTIDAAGFADSWYNPDLPTDVTVNATQLTSSPVSDLFVDIEIFPGFLGTSSGIVSAYQDNFDPNYGGLTDQLPECVPFEISSGVWEIPPTIADDFGMRYFHNEPAWGYFDVYDDINCTNHWQLQGPDQQFHDVKLAGSFTGGSAVQLRIGATIPNVFDNGTDSCDEWFGVSFYGQKQIMFDGPNISELAVQGTGSTMGDTFFCTDSFRDFFRFTYLPVSFTNQQFVEDPDDYSQIKMILTY